MLKKKLIFAVVFLFSSATLLAQEYSLAEMQNNIQQVERLYAFDSEVLDSQEVVTLSQRIIRQRELYNNNTLAKVFSLLADTATNSGDLARSMQFAQDGLSLIGVDRQLHLALLLKVASGHYYKGKFHRAKTQAEQAVVLAEQIGHVEFQIIALSYRAMANALIAAHELAMIDLELVERLLTTHPQFSNRIALLDVLANAHYYLGDNDTAIALYNKILKLRFELGKIANLDQTYAHLARSFLAIGSLDDAYNAFLESHKLASKKQAVIRIAYADSGLGKVYYHQGEYQKALDKFIRAEKGFHGYNLSHPYLSSLLDLAKVLLKLNRVKESYDFLKQAENVALTTELTEQQVVLHLMMAKMYRDLEQPEKAIQQYLLYAEKNQQFSHAHIHTVEMTSNSQETSNRSRDFSLQFANQTALTQQYQLKYRQQGDVIVLLSSLIVILLLIMLWIGFRLRAQRLNNVYDEIEKPADFIRGPSQTKKLYQHHFKMARKFEYPLAVGYFSIENWQELSFQFSRKVVSEVASTIAMIINETNDEFVSVGVINQGEYLLLAPHQPADSLLLNMEKIADSIQLHFFANLGEFSVKVRYDCQVPNIQDIDPYIFLSRLSDSTKS